MKFRAGHFFLSNAFPCSVPFDDLFYPSVEHAFQAAKTMDQGLRQLIRRQVFPTTAHRIGRNARLRPEWADMRETVMLQLLRTKFARTDLRRNLLATGHVGLVNGNAHGDRLWGAIHAEGRWEGANRLGILLMRVRDEIRSSQ